MDFDLILLSLNITLHVIPKVVIDYHHHTTIYSGRLSSSYHYILILFASVLLFSDTLTLDSLSLPHNLRSHTPQPPCPYYSTFFPLCYIRKGCVDDIIAPLREASYQVVRLILHTRLLECLSPCNLSQCYHVYFQCIPYPYSMLLFPFLLTTVTLFISYWQTNMSNIYPVDRTSYFSLGSLIWSLTYSIFLSPFLCYDMLWYGIPIT